MTNSQQIHSCSHCAMSQICLPLGVDKNDIRDLENLVQTSSSYSRNEAVFKQSEKFNKLYAVKSGVLKSTRIDENGTEYVLGFHLPGELIGLDGIYPGEYSSNTVALNTTVLCEIEYDQLTELCLSIPALQRQLLRILSRDIYQSNISNAANSEQTALQKLTSFINTLSLRYELRGYCADTLELAMSRQDIANHLEMTPETISRLFKRLKGDGLISIDNKKLVIHDHQAMRETASSAFSVDAYR